MFAGHRTCTVGIVLPHKLRVARLDGYREDRIMSEAKLERMAVRVRECRLRMQVRDRAHRRNTVNLYVRRAGVGDSLRDS